MHCILCNWGADLIIVFWVVEETWSELVWVNTLG